MTADALSVCEIGCTSHCRDCGRHFASRGAFDLHRKGRYAIARHCVDPIDELRLSVIEPAGPVWGANRDLRRSSDWWAS